MEAVSEEMKHFSASQTFCSKFRKVYSSSLANRKSPAAYLMFQPVLRSPFAPF